jgi:acetyl esterase/lipase
MRVLRDIPYAEARIGYNGGAGPMRPVTLAYDAYLPDAPAGPVPAVVLAFGGAFHRGSKEDDAFLTAGEFGPNTAIAEYCRRFAREGLACFSVRYRLGPEDPEPGPNPVLTRPDEVPMGRIEKVREIMGLPPATPREMAGVVEAAIADVTDAALSIRRDAARFGVDPDRMVLGGFSAGGRCALYAAYANRVPCVGVLSLSGVMQSEDVEAHVKAGEACPPLLLLTAEKDLDYISAGAGPALKALRSRGVDAARHIVTGRDHWYPAEAPTDIGLSVQAAMRDALRRWTGR